MPQGLHAALTLKLHYGAGGSALDLAHAFVVFNGSLPAGVKLASAPNGAAGRLDPRATEPATLDLTQHTLSATLGAGVLASTASFGTDAPVATFGKPDPFNVGLSAGSLSFDYPIDVPAGQGGLTPPVTLSYSSADVSEQHSVQGAAPWVGEGWTLSMGQISWAEHLVSSGNWDDSWQLSDPYGTAAELIPPTSTTSTFNDDTGHSIAGPTVWHTALESFVKVVSYPGPLSLGGQTVPCFRVFLQNGIMEEFGCTSDSLQYYIEPSGANQGKYYISSWLLDLITDRNGNQIHVTYTQDWESGTGGKNYPRDAFLSSIQYDSPTCSGTQAVQTACTTSGTAPNKWEPMIKITFAATHTPARFSPGSGPSGSCNTGSNLRCDDPLDLSGSGNMKAPQVQSTFVLNDIDVQVSSINTWNNLKDYQLSYEQSGPSTITDPASDQQESVAGMLDLTQIAEVGDATTTVPLIRTFSYTSVTEYYEDSAFSAPSGDCGPSWNASRCELWSQSYSGNSRYIASASNGLGLYQTFSWALGRNNTHGVDTGGNNADPLYCDSDSHQSGTRCSEADDQSWSHVILTQETDAVVRLSQPCTLLQCGTLTSTPVTSTTSYTYQLTAPLAAQACSDCVAGMYWGNQNDNDYLDFYNGKFMGFAQATVTNNFDHSKTVHKFYATLGWGLYDINQVTCFENPPNPCHNDPWWNLTNAAHGHEYEVDQYDTDGTTLLTKATTQYTLLCPPSGVSGTPANGNGNWNGNLVSELDPGNPVGDCDIQTTQVDTITADGSTNSGNPDQTVIYAYDSYGRVTSVTTTSNDGGATGSPTTIVQNTAYVWNNTVTTSTGQGTYLIAFPNETDTENSQGARQSCTYTSYDGLPYETGAQSNFTGAGHVTKVDQDTSCTTTPQGQIVTTSTYDQFGNQLTTTDPDANAGISGHVGCTVGSTQYSTCTAYDTTFETLPTSTTNALNQTSSMGYNGRADATGGFGLWPTSTTDVNGQTTTTTYDGLGRVTSQTLPGETSGLTTTSTSYTIWCASGSAQTPCVEIDTTQRLNSTTTITTRAFYDGFGRLVETRSPGPNGQDVVQYRYYDPNGRDIFDSIQYFVSAYTGSPGAAAYSIPNSSQPGTSATYTNLRSTTTTDALSHTATSSYAVVCSPAGITDTACYVQGTTIDPLGHQQSTLTDALGREIYDQRYTGNSPSTYAVYATTQYTYDFVGDLTQILHPDGVTKTTFQYDMVGRQTGIIDPDLGTESYVYDADGNVVQTTDARGSLGTIFAGYDGLDRQIWRNTTNSPTGAYVTYSYDSTANGNKGVGRLTGESFTGGPNHSLSGSYSNVYDGRGQLIQNTLTVGGTPYQSSASYDDAGGLLSLTYPNGDVLTTSYSAQGWFAGLTLQQGSTQTMLVSNVNYSGTSGAAGLASSASWNGGTYTAAATFDLLLRATDAKITRSSDQATLFEETPSYDAAGRVSSVSTTLPQGTDQQQFCYDEQNRLTWAGSVGTPPCTGTAITPGTLTSAEYTQSFTYDTLGRLTSGPLGAYIYGDSQHIHAATAIGSTYTATYDASGNMTCRAPTSATTCTGSSPTGAQLSYDNEGNLIAWQNAPSSPTSTAAYLYDGEGDRVEKQVTQGGTTSTTVYVGRLEEVTTTGTTTTTTYYAAGGPPVALAVNGVLSYLVTNRLGSVTETLDTSGNVEASLLYTPYGGIRYSTGTLPTTYGFTGQRQDANTGLDDLGARYYDPLAGQFISADLILPGGGANPWGLSRYAYVVGNPESFTDPTGQRPTDGCPGCVEQDGGVAVPPSNEWGPENPGMYLGPDVDGIMNWPKMPAGSWWNDGDGDTVFKFPNGSGEEKLPDGTVVTIDAEGNVTSWNGVPPQDQTYAPGPTNGPFDPNANPPSYSPPPQESPPGTTAPGSTGSGSTGGGGAGRRSLLLPQHLHPMTTSRRGQSLALSSLFPRPRLILKQVRRWGR